MLSFNRGPGCWRVPGAPLRCMVAALPEQMNTNCNRLNLHTLPSVHSAQSPVACQTHLQRGSLLHSFQERVHANIIRNNCRQLQPYNRNADFTQPFPARSPVRVARHTWRPTPLQSTACSHSSQQQTACAAAAATSSKTTLSTCCPRTCQCTSGRQLLCVDESAADAQGLQMGITRGPLPKRGREKGGGRTLPMSPWIPQTLSGAAWACRA